MSENTDSSTTTRRPLVIGSLVVAAVAVITVVAVILGSSGASNPATAPSTHTTTPNSTEANIASLSVARSALYVNKNPNHHVTAKDVTTAARPDKGALVIVHNYGTVKSDRSLIQFQWYFGGPLYLVCVDEPATRNDGTPSVVTCPPQDQLITPVKVTTPTTPPLPLGKRTPPAKGPHVPAPPSARHPVTVRPRPGSTTSTTLARHTTTTVKSTTTTVKSTTVKHK